MRSTILNLHSRLGAYLLALNVFLMPPALFAEEPAAAPTEEKKTEKTEEPAKKTEEVKPREEDKTAETKAPEVTAPEASKLFIAVSTGMASTRKGGTDWKSSGMSDIELRYHVYQFTKGSLAATLRYAPVDVAPAIENGDIHSEYKGVIEQYLLGASYFYPLADKLQLTGQGEFGRNVIALKRIAETTDNISAPAKSSVALAVSAGADWSVYEKFAIGARLRRGMGSITTNQMLLQASFGF